MVIVCAYCGTLFGCNLKKKKASLASKTWIRSSETGFVNPFNLELEVNNIGPVSTKPDSTSRSGRVKGRCALESAAARRDRASGLGRYLSVESASCGLGCRAVEAIKTCRLELIDKRIWVSYICLFLSSSVIPNYSPVVLLSNKKPQDASCLWSRMGCSHQNLSSFQN